MTDGFEWAHPPLAFFFAIDIEVCRRCGGKLEVIASIEELSVIERIFEYRRGGTGGFWLAS